MGYDPLEVDFVTEDHVEKGSIGILNVNKAMQRFATYHSLERFKHSFNECHKVEVVLVVNFVYVWIDCQARCVALH